MRTDSGSITVTEFDSGAAQCIPIASIRAIHVGDVTPPDAAVVPDVVQIATAGAVLLVRETMGELLQQIAAASGSAAQTTYISAGPGDILVLAYRNSDPPPSQELIAQLNAQLAGYRVLVLPDTLTFTGVICQERDV